MSETDFPEYNEMTDTRYGRMLYNRNDIYIGKSLQLYGEFSPGESDLFRAIVSPGMTVVEAGANIGAHTIPLARFTGPSGAVVVFEPQRIVFQTLCANIALNHLTNVVARNAAVGEKSATLIVPDLNPARTNNFGGISLEGCKNGIEVPVVTIDSLQLKSCKLIKADVEGMEESVLRGAEQTIRRCLPFLYLENDRQDKSESLVQYIVSLGYRIFIHNPPLYSSDNYRNNPENAFPHIVSSNLLCLHRSVPSRLSGFPELKVT
ncbi:MAG: FkbM family methyltransferase [Verrucomicrobiales bacterium]|nr:FkbM family methyltransferase [Verrucomicrobiales bacterium]